ncbi:MAG: hypothetical protein ACRDV8_03600 [Acidimicrobiales bacterium]
MTIALALLVAAGVLVYVIGNRTSKTPRARLESALLATNSSGTANLTLRVKASFDGISLAVTGTGAVDFATRAVSLQVSAFGQTLALVETSGSLYVNLGKEISTQFPGKTWVRMSLSTITSTHGAETFVTDNPQALMSLLLKLGATITPAGPATIDGTQDQMYEIHLSVAALEAHASALPPSIRSLFADAKTLPKSTQVSTTMYVNPAGELQAEHVALMVEEKGHPVTASVDLTMSHFGAASVEAPPPATQTVTYQQIKKSLGSGILAPSASGGVQAA